jgi:hypothetical protein
MTDLLDFALERPWLGELEESRIRHPTRALRSLWVYRCHRFAALIEFYPVLRSRNLTGCDGP